MVAETRLVPTLYVHCLPCCEVDFSSHIRIVMLAHCRITVHDLDTNEALYITVTLTEVTLSWSRVCNLCVSEVVSLV